MMKSILVLCVLVVAAIACSNAYGYAAFTGAVSEDWMDGGNWVGNYSPAGVPPAGESVYITQEAPSGGSAKVTLTDADGGQTHAWISVGGVKADTSYTLEMKGAAKLGTSGGFYMQGTSTSPLSAVVNFNLYGTSKFTCNAYMETGQMGGIGTSNISLNDSAEISVVGGNGMYLGQNGNHANLYVKDNSKLYTASLWLGGNQPNGGGPAYLSIQDNATVVATSLVVGYNKTSVSTFDMSGGTLNAGEVVVGLSGTGTMNMTGGTLNAETVKIQHSNCAMNMTGGVMNLSNALSAANADGGTIDVSGGTIYASDLNIGTYIDMVTVSGSGKVILTGDKVAKVQGYIDSGLLTSSHYLYYRSYDDKTYLDPNEPLTVYPAIWIGPVGGDGLWNTPDNWDPALVPTSTSEVRFNLLGMEDCSALSPFAAFNIAMTTGVLNIRANCQVGNIAVGWPEASSTTPVLNISGTAEVNSTVVVAIANSTDGAKGTMNISDDAILRTTQLAVGRLGQDANGVCNLTDDAQVFAGPAQYSVCVGWEADGTLNMTDNAKVVAADGSSIGVTDANGFLNISGNAAYITGNSPAESWNIFMSIGEGNGRGQLNMTGGYLYGYRFSIGTPWHTGVKCRGIANISGGFLKVDQLSVAGKSNSRLAASRLTISGNGVVETNNIENRDGQWAENGTIEILDNGVLRVKGNVTGSLAALKAWDNSNMIITVRQPVIEYDSETDWTTCRAPNLKAAYSPIPSNGKQYDPESLGSITTLSWTAGDGAVTHRVYLGTNYADVSSATPADVNIYRGTRSEPNYPTSDGNKAGKTYFWRIDEVDGSSSVTKGGVWSFTNGTYLIIDDFESYTNDAGMQAVWAITTGTPTRTLSAVSLGGKASDGTQSMKYSYSTASSPYRNELTKTYAIAQNWNSFGVESLYLAFQGDNNAITNPTPFGAKMYIKLADASNKTATVNYDGDVNDVIQYFWQQNGWKGWNIDLAAFTEANNVNMAAIKKVTIGFGTGALPGGTNKVYFDSIRAYPPRCLASKTPVDLNGDCRIDISDVVLLAQDWLKADYNVTAAATEPVPGPIVWYQFNESTVAKLAVIDSSGNVYDGNYSDGLGSHIKLAAPLSPAGGNYVLFGGAFDINIPGAAFSTLNDKISLCFWEYVVLPSPPALVTTWSFYTVRNGTTGMQVNLPWNDGQYIWASGLPGADYLRYTLKNPSEIFGQWNHFAMIKDGNNMSLYENGILIASNTTSTGRLDGTTAGYLGGWSESGLDGSYMGRMDDFRMYDYALSQAQVMKLAFKTEMTVPVVSGANANKDNIVNFKDFALMAENWLTNPMLWPN